MSSSDSTVTYTSVSSKDVPFWVPQDKDEREPMFIQPHDPDYVPEPMYPEYTQEDGPVDYPMDGGDDDDGNSSGDDADDEDKDEEDEEEEDHLSQADSAIVIPMVKLVFPPKGTEPVIPPPSTDIATTEARITVRLQAAISLPPEAEVERLLAMPTLSPSPLTSLSPPSTGESQTRCTAPSACPSPPPVPSPLLPSSGCPTQIQTLRMASTQALIDVVTVALPSPPLPPLPPPLYIPLPVDRRDDVPKTEMPPCKRLCLSTLGSRYEIRESSATKDTWVDPAETVGLYRGYWQGEVHTRVTELTELHEHDTHDLYALLEDAQDKELSRVQNTFHVSNLKKCHADEPLAVPLDGLHADDKLHFVEEPVEIMDHNVKQLKRSQIPLVKVRWNSKRGPEFTWEREDQFRKKYPHLFTKTAPSSSVVS
uniref:Putative reverse transcriptase domain-containing protein n=1 Tax=Tanacetum cinerariifolium TaxID=118510 RepID=A0A6L2MR40_TANCI|nr:putative reverse transcriptase domain-containing protein [Tanacetum cinerariifolium]